MCFQKLSLLFVIKIKTLHEQNQDIAYYTRMCINQSMNYICASEKKRALRKVVLVFIRITIGVFRY